LTTISAIDCEVAIEGKHDAFLIEFGHSDQASIGKRHRDVRELLHQSAEGVDLSRYVKVASDNSSSNKFQYSVGPSASVLEEKAGLRKYSVAGKHWRLDRVHDRSRPGVMVLASIEQGDERTGIDDDRSHLP
jgi:hypothetical protein